MDEQRGNVGRKLTRDQYDGEVSEVSTGRKKRGGELTRFPVRLSGSVQIYVLNRG